MTAALDVQRLILPEMPPHWPDLPQPLKDALSMGGGTLWHHSGCREVWHRGQLAYACAATCPVRLAEQTLARRWFLIVNEPVVGIERPRCKYCNAQHQYLSNHCVEIPWNGTTEVIAKFRGPTIAANGDAVTECLRLGALVPITAAEALVLKTRIRAKGGHIK